ncbi:MAG TPA: phosphodiester glycosidase family protein [Caulobacteraceae bacterium]|jgi:uncharacterized protein YigE (DUF2233 family)|nr:phosphodiester glycosidase family protein [Caulobacteraceae bacterium]
MVVALAGAMLSGGARAGECHPAKFEGSRFTVCAYRAGVDELRLESRGGVAPVGSLRGLRVFLGADAGRVDFAMNAGMYAPDRSPLGLFVAASTTLKPLNRASGAGNFFLTPNGVFWIGADGAAHVEATGAFAAADRRPVWATQSGPLLAQGGQLNPHITANGPSLAIRNAVGAHGADAVFVISDDRVSFGRLARFMRDGLGCPDVLYLDGSISGLWAPGLGRLDQTHGLGTFVIVLRHGGA